MLIEELGYSHKTYHSVAVEDSDSSTHFTAIEIAIQNSKADIVQYLVNKFPDTITQLSKSVNNKDQLPVQLVLQKLDFHRNIAKDKTPESLKAAAIECEKMLNMMGTAFDGNRFSYSDVADLHSNMLSEDFNLVFKKLCQKNKKIHKLEQNLKETLDAQNKVTQSEITGEKLKQLESTICEYKNERTKTAKKMFKLESESRSEIDNLKSQKSELLKKINSEKSTESELRKEINKLKQDNQDLTTKNISYEDHFKNLTKKVKQSEKKFDKLHKGSTHNDLSKNQTIEALNCTIADLQFDFDTKTEVAETTKINELKKLDRTISDQKLIVQQLQDQLCVAYKKIEKLEPIQVENNSFEQTIAEIKTDFQNQLVCKDKEISMLKLKPIEKPDETHSFKSEIVDLRQKMIEKDSQITTYANEIRTEQATCDGMKEQLSSIQKFMADIFKTNTDTNLYRIPDTPIVEAQQPQKSKPAKLQPNLIKYTEPNAYVTALKPIQKKTPKDDNKTFVSGAWFP